uniref:Amine oxidase domain-containing protein n=1 Tax=viral metagenome TaxID=1070528 RepID=A0A6C0KY35_9ZZZZ
MNNANYYDVIIVGGGISGLYSAYNILKILPKTKILILEAFKKTWFGGRIGNANFYGTSVVKGAGVGRKKKDYLLIKLLTELKLPFSEFSEDKYYASTIHPPCNLKSVISSLQNKFKERKHLQVIHPTFKNFVLPLLGAENYKHFVTCMGYSDFENEDAYDVLFNYGFEDNYGKMTGLHIPWQKLIDTIAKKIGKENIRFSSKVTSIKKCSDNEFLVELENQHRYTCEKCIIATTIKSVVQLLPSFSIYKKIHGQQFLRVYGKFTAKSIPILKHYIRGYTIVPGPLQKIVPINADKGVYLIAYSDNESAKYFKDNELLENNNNNREFFCSLIKKSLGIAEDIFLIAIKDFYWPIGTHYCEPLDTQQYKSRSDFMKKAQHPMHNMLVVGEMVSNDQGWTEGALDSVKKVVTEKWLLN